MLVSSEVSGLRLRQEVFGQAEDLTDVDVVDDVDVGVVHVHVVHRVLAHPAAAAESIEGTSETDKQEWTMSLRSALKRENANGYEKHRCGVFVVFVFECSKSSK